MRRIVAAFDSFKGSLTSLEAGEAFRCGIVDVCPDADVKVLAIADGGEGMAEAVKECVGGEWVVANVHDPLGRSIEARYVVINDGHTAVMAMSAASGLTLLAADELNPLYASTYGTGELILDAIGRGCSEVIVGLGGSATNDGGAGMLRALGYRFYDDCGRELTATIGILERVSRVSAEERSDLLNGVRLRVAADVDSPLYGPMGASHVFARQKGADDNVIERMDRAMQHYANVVDKEKASWAGAGAAGGMGYAFMSLLGAEMRSGIDVILSLVDFDAVASEAQLIATGEGSVDYQTLRGKAPHGVLTASMRLGIPCVVVGGRVSDETELISGGFSAVYEVTPRTMPLSVAMQKSVAMSNVRAVGRRVACEWLKGSL